MVKIISGWIDKNYDYWATVNGEAFADIMYDIADNQETDGVAYETDRGGSVGLGGKRAMIPNCNISMYFSKKEMEYEEAEEKFLDQMFMANGMFELEANYVGYSEYTITGFDLDECTLGGHDINNILCSHMGEYVNIRVEVN